MRETHPIDEHTIDLFALFETLWNGKWKIIAIIFFTAILLTGFSLLKPSYRVSTNFTPSQSSVFAKYTSLNDILKSNGLNLSINASALFQMIVYEFNDYEEMINILEDDAFIQASVDELSAYDRSQTILRLAKFFVIDTNPKKSTDDWNINFEWHDPEKGKALLNSAMNSVLLNVKTMISNTIIDLANSIDEKNARQIDALKARLSIILEQNQDRVNKELLFLSEQTAIAKELGIESSQLDATNISQVREQNPNSVSLSINSNAVPFYLRGYKAIDKEISLLLNRNEEQRLLMSDGYLETKEKLVTLENNLVSIQLRKSLSLLEESNTREWVNFNLDIADIERQKKPILFLAFSIVLGGIIGVIYVLISNIAQKRKQLMASSEEGTSQPPLS